MSTETNSMTDEPVFLDTNILAYACDRSDAKRRKVYEKIVKSGFLGESSSK
jgi:predicted nucleic acid-binding protein